MPCRTPAPAPAPDTSRGELPVHRRRRLHGQRLVRTLFVVLAAEPVEGPLLGPPVGRRRRRRRFLQRAVHPFMSSVLLRVAGLDALRHDAQLDPPHRQPRQPGHRARGERRPVVGAHHLRHPVLAKRRFEDGLHPLRVGLVHRLAAQQVTAAASVMVSGSIRSPSVVRIQPLKSAPTRRWARAHRPNGCCKAAPRRRFRRCRVSPSRSSIAPMVLAAGHAPPRLLPL